MAEKEITVLDTCNNIRAAFEGKLANQTFCIKMYSIADKTKDTKNLSEDAVRICVETVHKWNVMLRADVANKLSSKKIYKGVNAVNEELQHIRLRIAKNRDVCNDSDILNLKIINSKITYPMYGNKHCLPYGSLYVTDGKLYKYVDLKEDYINGNFNGNYITLNRKRYYVKDIGSYMAVKFIVDVEKTKEYRDRRGKCV